MVFILCSDHYTKWNKTLFAVLFNCATLGILLQNLFTFLRLDFSRLIYNLLSNSLKTS